MGMSLEWAETVSTWSNWILFASLVVGGAATFGVVVSADVKETALKRELAAQGAVAAQANERAVAAQLDLERERTARLELERKFGPRILSPEQRATLVARLKTSGVTAITIWRVDDMEAAIAAERMRLALSADGIDAKVGSIGTMIPPRYGATVFDPAGENGPVISAFRAIEPGLQLESKPPIAGPTPGLLLFVKPFPE